MSCRISERGAWLVQSVMQSVIPLFAEGSETWARCRREAKSLRRHFHLLQVAGPQGHLQANCLFDNRHALRDDRVEVGLLDPGACVRLLAHATSFIYN